jgi:Copper amine oxidase N-terminal domain.
MRMKRWLALALSALLLFAAGCQAVQGIDLNAVLKASTKTVSYEGSAVFELNVDLSEDLLDEMAAVGPEFAALIPLFTQVKLELDEIKMQNASNFSMSGTLTLGDIGIGFAMHATDELMVIELDGARAPIVIDLAELNAEFPQAGLSPEQQREAQELALNFLDTVGDYLYGNMPNVSDLSVALNTPATVGGEELSLTRVSVRLDGAELLGWLKSYFIALSEDEEGVRTFMQAVADFALEQSKLIGPAGAPFDGSLFGEDGEPDIENAIAEWTRMLESASLALSLLEVSEPELTQAIFSENLTVSADLYLDGKLQTRKQDFEISFRPDKEDLATLVGDDSLAGLDGIRIAYSAEMWNINGDVELAAPQVPEDGGVTPEEMGEWSTAEALRFFGAGSGMFELLAGRLNMGEQVLWFDPEFSDPAPIKAPNGLTLVPLRHTAEWFEAEVVYDPETRKLILRDDATEAEIEFTVGSDLVVVNGETVQWGYPVTVMADGTAYVPGRNLIETLGGTIAWKSESGSPVLYLKRNVAELVTP